MAESDGLPPLLVICGPTAGGKTDFALALAGRFDGEIVNADSRQVYRQMDIGTAKPTPAQRAQVPHHLFDLVDPDEPFTLATYLDLAHAAILEIQARSRLPMLVGGTGLYIRAVAQGYDVPRVVPDRALRAQLESELAACGLDALVERLHRTDPLAAARVDARNPRRVIRAIEVAEAGADSTSGPASVPRYRTLVLGLTAERAELHRRADRRVDEMVAAGFVDEVRVLLARGYGPDLPAMSSLGYREMIAFLDDRTTLDEAIQATKFATHRFIRRQLTWFRQEPGLRWLDLAGGDAVASAEGLVECWLAQEAAGEPVLGRP
jgi:tRNA dimethylallyltransferase